MTFGEYLRHERQRQGIRQADLAQALGVTRQTVMAWENDVHIPSLDIAVHLATRLRVPLERLAAPFLSNSQGHRLLWPYPHRPSPTLPVIWANAGATRVLVPVTLLATPRLPDAWYDVNTDTITPLPMARNPDQVILMAGCDPFMSWLQDAFHQLTHAYVLDIMAVSSTRALTWWQDEFIHIAGTHLFDAQSGQYNPPHLAGRRHQKIPYITWQEGLLYHPRRQLLHQVAIREPGSEAHALYQRQDQKPNAPTAMFLSHQALLDAVLSHPDWGGVGLGPLAALSGLEFTPWAEEHYELWVREEDGRQPWLDRLQRVIQSQELTRRLDSIPYLHRP